MSARLHYLNWRPLSHWLSLVSPRKWSWGLDACVVLHGSPKSHTQRQLIHFDCSSPTKTDSANQRKLTLTMTTKLVVPLLRKSRHFAQTHRLPISIQTYTTTLHHQHPLFHITNRRNHTNSSNELPAPSSNDYFPWRHSPSLPARIENGDDFSGMPNNFRARFIRRTIAGQELNLKFWDLLPLPFERGWEQELAGNFSTGENRDASFFFAFASWSVCSMTRRIV